METLEQGDKILASYKAGISMPRIFCPSPKEQMESPIAYHMPDVLYALCH